MILHIERTQLELKVVSISLTKTPEVRDYSVLEVQRMGSCNGMRNGWW